MLVKEENIEITPLVLAKRVKIKFEISLDKIFYDNKLEGIDKELLKVSYKYSEVFERDFM